MGQGPLTALEVLVLAGLSDRARYGYELVERIEVLSQGRVEVRPGNLYRVIHRLTERGWVEEAEQAADPREDDRRQYFRTTVRGREVARDELAMYREVLDSVPALGEDPEMAPEGA